MAKDKKKTYASIEEELEDLGSKLSEKQLLFCEYYLPTLNGTTSYQKTYGVSYITAQALGSRLIANDKVRAYIECMKRLRAREMNIGVTDILAKYKAIAFSDINDYMSIQEVEGIDPETGETYTYNRVLLKKSKDIDGTIVTEIVKDSKGGIKIKLADKMAALKFLSNYTNMLNDDELRKLQAAKLRHELDEIEKRQSTQQSNIVIVDEWSK